MAPQVSLPLSIGLRVVAVTPAPRLGFGQLLRMNLPATLRVVE